MQESWSLVRAIGMAGLISTAGCTATTPTAQKAATAALAQLSTYEIEVQRKIKAENDYYEKAMDAASARVEELWDNEQPFQFEQEAKKFAFSNLKVSAAKMGPKIIKLMEDTRKSWAARDTKYESLLTGTQKTLQDNRKKLEFERGKIKTLRNKLQVLSAARSNKETLALTIAFAKLVKEKYDELDKAGAGAASAATKEESN